MRKLLIYTLMLAATVLLATSNSCVSSQSPFPVKGKGELKNKTYNVSNFQGVDVSGGFDVDLVQGNSESLELSAQENLFEYINVEVEGGILKIYIEKNVMSTKAMKARIYLKSINNLKVSGGGDINSETGLDVPNLAITLSGGGNIITGLKTGKLNGRISGGGDVKIDGNIEVYDMNISGGGDIHSELTSGEILCTITGGGNVDIKNTNKASRADFSVSGGGDLALNLDADFLKCSISGGGGATLNGKANILEIGVNGGGNVNAGDFVATKATFKANGGSDIRINVSEELTGNISGGGNVYYSGNPTVVNIDAKGGSSVRKE